MKKYFVFIFLSLFMVLSCSKNKKTDIQIEKEEIAIEENSIPDENKIEEILEPIIPCVLFYDSAYIWSENKSGILDAVTLLYSGQELFAYPSNSDKIGEELFTKDFSRAGHLDSVENYTKIFYKDKEYWINSHVIAPYTKAGLIIDTKAIVYNSPDVLDVGSVLIPQFQLIAINTNFETPSSSDVSFSKVTFRSEEKTSRNCYVKSSVISSFPDDVKAFRFLNKAALSEKKEIKEELLANCINLELSEEMKQKLEEDTETILYEYIPDSDILSSTESDISPVNSETSENISEDFLE